MQVALTIAGSDPSAGAGIQADLKTLHAHGVYGLTAITAVTVQNTQKVFGVQKVKPEIVRDQILCLYDDFEIKAVKIGMLLDTDIVYSIIQAFEKTNPQNVVLDPVMISKSGYALLKEETREVLKNELLPRADLITPNIPEAEVILNTKINSVQEMYQASEGLFKYGAKRTVLKGGHLPSNTKIKIAKDIYYDGQSFLELEDRYIQSKNTHGTGCTFSAAIAANLALGHDYAQAAVLSKKYLTEAIARGKQLGKGQGPTNHFWQYNLGS
jgi:hydroxymethylpyrimidine/phosphomethylpyrimidine kinase